MAAEDSPRAGTTAAGSRSAVELLDAEKRGIIRRLAADILNGPLPDELAREPGFRLFVQEKSATTPRRFEEGMTLVIQALQRSGVAGGARTAAALARRDFAALEKTFTRQPPDHLTREHFVRHFVRVAETHPGREDDYLELMSSAEFLAFRKLYREHERFYMSVLARLAALAVAPRGTQKARGALDLLGRDSIVGLSHCADSVDQSEAWERALFAIFAAHAEPAAFFALLDAFAKHYRIRGETALQNSRRAGNLYVRLAAIWDHLRALPADRRGSFVAFLRLYGKERDEFQNFVWDCVYEAAPEKHLPLVELFITDAFTSIRNFYAHDAATLKILIRSIASAMVEAKIRSLNTSLYQIALRLLLQLRVERNFLARRASFYAFLRKKTNSVRVEMEFVRLLIFEYILIGSGRVQIEMGMVMTHFIDELHRAFCLVVDRKQDPIERRNREALEAAFAALVDLLQEAAWAPAAEKFSASSYLLLTIRSAAVSLGVEDPVLGALEVVTPQELPAYHEAFMDYFRRAPDRLAEAAAPDFWHRMPLSRAMPHLQAAVVPLVGSVSIQPGTSGAYTDGRSIFLPEYLNLFKDPRDPIEANRNLTCYLGLALHEAGHILGGSFVIDIDALSSRQEKPDLFRWVLNVFEDYRIEKFLIGIEAHPQAEELLRVLNLFFSLRNLGEDISAVRRFLNYVFDAAWGIAEALHAEARYLSGREELLARPYPSGRFRALPELFGYVVERLRQMPPGNPLAAPALTQEVYDILRHWPAEACEGPFDAESFWSGLHNRLRGGGLAADPMSLNELYRRCNEHPEEFLAEHELPFFPELFRTGHGEAPSDAAAPGPGRAGGAVADLLPESTAVHSEAGSIDFSTRTRVDDLSAEKQKKAELRARPVRNDRMRGGRTKRVLSIDPRTRSRTRLSEVREFTLRGRDAEFLRRSRRWQHVEFAVERMLSTLLPRVDEDSELNLFDGDISLDRMIEVLAERRGAAPDFLETTVESRQTAAVVIGLDVSGSTGRYIDMGEELVHEHHRTTIVDVEKVFAMIFARALQSLAQEVSILAFNSATSTNVYRAADIESVSLFKADEGNRDGDFVRYVTAELSAKPFDLKYFFLISDGIPAALNYEGEEAIGDTLVAMRECVRGGIRLVYFNVDVERADYYEQFANEATHAEHFRRPESLLPAIPRMLRQIALAVR